MRFITEDELRTKYRQIPFSIYKIEKNNRLTPGAKQFLTDFRIKIENWMEEDENIIFNKDTEVNIFDKRAEQLKCSFSKLLALEVKMLAIKFKAFNKEKAEKLNSISITLFQGLKLSVDKDQLMDDFEDCLEKNIFISLDDEKAELAIEVMRFDIKLCEKEKYLRRQLENLDCKEKKEILNSQIKTLRIIRGEVFKLFEEV